MSSSGPLPAIIVLEEGGQWPEGATPGAVTCPLLIRQNAGENPADFSARVERELGRFPGRGAVDVAVVACGERSEKAALTARRNTSTAILSFMARRGLGVLLLAESARPGPGRESQVAPLAQDLDAEWEDLGLRVSVWPPPSSRLAHGSGAEGVSGVP